MARRRVDQRVPGLDSRDALWAAIRTRETFTIPAIREVTRLGYDTVREYILGLEAAGYVARAGGGGSVGQAVLYLALRLPHEAPRVRSDGTPVTQGQGREQLWRTIPILKEFSPRELALASSIEEHTVSEAEAKHYCLYLHRAGYLARITTGRYRHLPSRRSGPLPPQIQRIRQVWDPNLGAVVWPPDGAR